MIFPGHEVMESVTKEEKSYTSSTPSFHASSATKELDDLMASLSDFKVRKYVIPIDCLCFWVWQLFWELFWPEK